ncbi:MAG: hypothetical protein ACRDA3_13155 [Peptostreptococcaceae bacterium]
MATIVKYECDACKKEVGSVKELYTVEYLDIAAYRGRDSVEVLSKEICIDCFYAISEKNLEILYGTLNWLKQNT